MNSPQPENQSPVQTREQQRYADAIEWGARVGFVVLVASFGVYTFGWLPARVPAEELAGLWTLPLADYLQRTGTPTGWGWLMQLPRSDAASLLGIVLLAGCSVPALLAVLPLALKRGDRLLAVLCLAEVAVIALAATGWLSSGH